MDLKEEILDGLYVSEEFKQCAARVKMRRIAGRGVRLYVDENDNRFVGATKCADLSMPKTATKYLETWRNKMTAEWGSIEKVDEYVQNTADYGTAVHVAIANFFTFGKLDYLDFQGVFDEYFVKEARGRGVAQSVIDAAYYEAQKDLIGILQFIEDYDVQPLSVEQMCKSLEIRTATPIDLPCRMNAKNYKATAPEKRRRITALLNIKTSKYKSGATHEFQCAAEWICWQESFGDSFPAHVVATIRPTAWKDTPKYDYHPYDISEHLIGQVKSAMKHNLKYCNILDVPSTKILSEMWAFNVNEPIIDGYRMVNLIKEI